jgi:hypothetical protein
LHPLSFLPKCWIMPDQRLFSTLRSFLAVCLLIYAAFIISQIFLLLCPVYIMLWPLILLLRPLFIPIRPILSSRRDRKLKLFNDFERQRVVDGTLLWILLTVGYWISFGRLLGWVIEIVWGYVKWEVARRGLVISWASLIHIRRFYGMRRM